MTNLVIPPDLSVLFAGDGEMASRCRALDWGSTSLGPVDQWPAALRTAVRMALECPFPINLWCGNDLLLIYNDAYRAVLGSKHPDALGQPGRVVWSEIWPQIAPMFDAVRQGGSPVFAENARFLMERDGAGMADAWFTFSLSAVRDDTAGIVAFAATRGKRWTGWFVRDLQWRSSPVTGQRWLRIWRQSSASVTSRRNSCQRTRWHGSRRTR